MKLNTPCAKTTQMASFYNYMNKYISNICTISIQCILNVWCLPTFTIVTFTNKFLGVKFWSYIFQNNSNIEVLEIEIDTFVMLKSTVTKEANS